MKIFNLLVFLSFSACLFGQVATKDATKHDAKAAEVLDQVAKAVAPGGSDTIESMVISGSMQMPQGITAKMLMYYKQGGKIYQKLEIKAQGMQNETVMGCDGTDCYQTDPMMGTRLLEGQEKEDLIKRSDPSQYENWRSLYHVVTYKGEDTVDGKNVHKIYTETESGMKQTVYIDAESKLILKSDVNIQGPMGNMEMKQLFKDYRDIHKGYLWPHILEVQTMGMTMSMTSEEIEVNVAIPDSRFEVPASLKSDE